MTKETKQAFDERFGREMAESADGRLRLGVIDAASHKLTMRELNRAEPDNKVTALTGSEIRGLRERAKMTQAVFARHLQLTADHVSKLEREEKRPSGPALVLLNLIRRKGIEAML
jgi:putative transcriptional regulator